MKRNYVILTCLLLGLGKFNSEAQIPDKPNIIFILSDDHAYQAISAYGSKLVNTPRIDQLASEGTLFQNAFVTNSICGPSRATLLSGQYSHKNGYKTNEKGFDLNQALFPQELNKIGYQTAWVGKWHLESLPGSLFNYWNILPGQGEYYNPDFINVNQDTVRYEGYVSDIITQHAEDFLEKRDPNKPFMLVVGHKATHRSWLPDLQDLGAYDSLDFPLPANFYDDYADREAAADQDMTIAKTMTLDTDLKVHPNYNKSPYNRFSKEQRTLFEDYYNGVAKDFESQNLKGKDLAEWKYQRYLKDYLATARSLDRNIGELMDYLKSHGLDKNTIVIYASDQGFYLGEHGWFDKRFMYEQSLKTAMIVRNPFESNPKKVVTDFVQNIDWAPTILDYAGAQIPTVFQGKSFKNTLDKEASNNGKDAVYYHYYEFPQPHHVHPHFGVRTERYKLVRFYGTLNTWELYDLEQDPQENSNRIQVAALQPEIKKLKLRLNELIDQYEDTEAAEVLRQEKQK